MVDSGITKATIQATTFPVLAANGNYYLRYRIASQDKISTSLWSPVYEITPKPISTIIGASSTVSSDYLNAVTNTYQSDGTNIFLTWNIPAALTNASFDIYAKWNNNSTGSSDSDSTWNSIGWTYLGTTTSNNFHYAIPSGYIFSYSGTTVNDKFVKLRVQVAMSQKVSLGSATLFRTIAKSTKPTSVNGGAPSDS